MYLLVSSHRDFATDYVVKILRHRGVEYRRLDLDLLHQDEVILDPVRQRLTIASEGGTWSIDNASLRGVLYRAPTHLRESSADRWPAIALLARHQWTAFARSLMVLDHPVWVNHPASTYQAENKPYQLMAAQRLGFVVPETRVTNSGDVVGLPEGADVAVKALDTFLLRVDGPEERDAFLYTQILSREELSEERLQDMPVVMQHALQPKLDLRVTVVGRHVFAASIVGPDGAGIAGDWRLMKSASRYLRHDLPADEACRCVDLVRRLGLRYAGIDLALVDGRYYFLELNPTGEWAWLEEALEFPVSEAIVNEFGAE